MIIKSVVFICFCWLFFSTALFSQDAPFSQYYSNLIYLNPAFAGTRTESRVNVFYRNQWPSSGANFQSYGISYDTPLKKYNSGLGIIATNESSGVFMNPSVDVIYNYKFKPSKYFIISTALQIGIVQKYFLESGLDFGDFPETVGKGFNTIYPDFAIGVTLFYKKIYAGFSLDHIAKPYQGVSRSKQEQLNRKYTLFVGYLYSIKSRLINQQRIVSPNILIQMQGAQNNICWGASFQYDNILTGLWLRNNVPFQLDAAIIMAGYRNQKWRVAYSYDINIGKKTNLPLGSHEISFVKLFEPRLKRKFKAISCPTFLL